MRLKQDPKFLMVQYAPGAAGKFLSSLLMSSPSIAHFDPDVQKNKSIDNCVDYVRNHFTKDIDKWILQEPNHVAAWNLHFISSKYDRGDNLTTNEFCSLAEQHASDYFCSAVNDGKIIPSIWHKTNTPEFFNNALFVTVILDKPSLKWYHRSIWYKLFGTKNGKIHLKANDPELNPPMREYFKKFKNPIYVDEPFYSFVKHNILKNKFKSGFMTTGSFTNHNQHAFVYLSELLDIDLCVEMIDRICQKFNLEPIPIDIIKQGHAHWIACHNFKYGTQ